MGDLKDTSKQFQEVIDGLKSFASTIGGQHDENKVEVMSSFDAINDITFIDLDELVDPYANMAGLTQYKITFDPNGGSGTMVEKIGYHGKNIKLPKNRFVNEGHDFVGWKDSADAEEIKYNNRQSIKIVDDKILLITLYAEWKIKSYSITFSSNGGSGTMSSKTAEWNSNVALPKCTFTKSGYKFVGWSTNAAATSAQYSDGGSISIKSNITLHAIWKVATTFTISYDSNGGSGTMSSQTVENGKSLTLRKNAFTRTGASFTGWATSASASKAEYSDEKTITPTKSLKLYAIWYIAPPRGFSSNNCHMWYGRVNYWAKDTSSLKAEIAQMKKKGLTGYMIEAAIYNENKIKKFKSSDLDDAKNKKIYDDWLSNVDSKYKYLLGLCRENQMWLFISIVNDNAVGKKVFTSPAFLYNRVAKDILKIVKKYGKENVVVQPSAEVSSTRGLEFNTNTISELKNLGYITVNGGANHGDDSNKAGAKYMAYHQSKYNLKLGTPSKTFIISDNTTMINWLKESTANVKKWKNWVKGQKYLVCGYYDISKDRSNTKINSMEA